MKKVMMMLRLSLVEYDKFITKRKGRKSANGGRFALGSCAPTAIKISPHAKALALLAKNPDLIKGKQEHFLQVSIFDFFERYHPAIYEFMCAYPAGGLRSKKVGAEIKAEGGVSGYPDILLDLPRGVYHGARFELKTDVGTLQATQSGMLKRLSSQGYYCTARKGFDDMVAAILAYSALVAGETLEHGQFDGKWLDYQGDN